MIDTLFKILGKVIDFVEEKYKQRQRRKDAEARAKFEAEVKALQDLEAARVAARNAQKHAEEAAKISGAAQKEMEHRP